MKKILSFVLAAVALVFTACSNDENFETSGNGQNNKGMVLVATVSQQDSRAAIDANETFGTWKFTFTDNDNVVVGNNNIDNYYIFTKSGETFSSTDAKVTSPAADWYAYYPGTDINLTNQEGTAESAAKLYALAGKTAEATTGVTPPLQIKMYAKAAVLRIVKVDNYGPCDIYLKTADGKYVSGLKAKKNEAGYDVEISETKVSVFTKASEGNAGIYYVIVPAGVKISVYNSDKLIKSTKDPGLKAGQYYTLTSGPTEGTATAKLADGTTMPVKWKQLWIGGPRIATEDVAKMMSWNEDVKQGNNYVWGSLWRTPSASEVRSLTDQTVRDKIVQSTYTYTNNTHGFTFKGLQPGYTKNEIYLRGKDTSNESYIESVYLLSDKDNKNSNATTLEFIGYSGGIVHIGLSTTNSAETPHHLRPVLSQETVLWGEQDIK
ncbi:fimbrillin family protein [uncultured Prevotella sp.]|uniref:fimbrillin family protein n=1 Tax=uncultured Prevotella sp. TaxID=159272 RepID=UPI00260AE937|nr:fimbrillin family protein [uncultured Prevotella sp.]